MDLQHALIPHWLPIWFLVLSLFLPRVCLLIAWFGNNLAPFALNGLLTLIVGALVPRILILVLIYQDRGGIGFWFIVHLIALVLAWGGGGTRYVRNRRGEVVEVAD